MRSHSTIALYSAFILSGAATVILGPLIPELSAGWTLPFSIANLFLLQFGACGIGAWLSSRNARRSLVLGYGLVSLALCGLGLGGWAAPIAVTVIGFGLGLSIPATNVLVARLNPDRSGAALSYLNLLWAIGAIGCPLLFAAAARHASAAGAAPWVLAGCAAAACVSVARTTRPSQSEASVVEDAAAGSLSIEVVVLLTAQLFAYAGTECTIGGWIAKYYTEVDPSGASRGFLVNAFFWGGLLSGRLVTPTVLKRIPEATLHAVALVVSAAGVVALLTARSYGTFGSGAFIVGLGLAPLFPLLAALVVRRTEGAQRRVSGRIFSIGGLGAGIVPWLAGQIADGSGSVRESFLVPVVGVALMSLMLWRYRSLQAVVIEISSPDGVQRTS